MEDYSAVEVKGPGIIARQSFKSTNTNWCYSNWYDDSNWSWSTELIIGDRQTGKTTIAIDAIIKSKILIIMIKDQNK